MYVILEKKQKGKRGKVFYEPIDAVETYQQAKDYIRENPLNFVIDFTSKAIREHYS